MDQFKRSEDYILSLNMEIVNFTPKCITTRHHRFCIRTHQSNNDCSRTKQCIVLIPTYIGDKG